MRVIKKRGLNLFVFSVLAIAGCANSEYSGKGGMTGYSISPGVYEYHYENGFTGVDAMGWDPNLQYAWSRAGAALTCGIEFDIQAVLLSMSEKYGDSPFMHDLNGVGFHHLQSKKITGFCSTARVDEIKNVIPKLEAGEFPQIF